jgi:putative FmdB family regulatory protein
MPFYEYECQACKFYAEVMQKITDAPLVACPSCGKRTLKKLVSAPVFRLKGGGWYETDFKSDKEGKRNLHGADKEETKAEGKTEAKADVKADTKAEAKADAKESKPAAKEAKESRESGAAPRRARSAARPATRGKSARKKGARRTRR